ncbi:hypothetical protein LTR84_000994 [Exophiala bonariae]|uniref:tRNA(Phe) 7-[(3-amino-3-carboxypropyl)-4-demethylwyosine(37)-N(4)]-methyltransferase n=1 Tax=Exophiala bonariae TaxID=1690606 RepID=A0AAV9NSJ7_9EURO|nr:hypothetical protein LTR84_000994 [Exophiala bonariae]
MARPGRHLPVTSSPPSSLRIPEAFTARKRKILSELQQPDDEYTDKSPKGNVDVQIRDLIDEINGIEGYVTTSSCAGRVAVFVEGGDSGNSAAERTADLIANVDVEASDDARDVETSVPLTRTSPGGKGGGHWLYVSHDPIPDVTRDGSNVDRQVTRNEKREEERFTQLFGLSSSSPTASQEDFDLSKTETKVEPPSRLPRLVHLSFSPLILHIHCATLQHARPLLAAAINAGFRESGVQSLRALDDSTSGVMLAIRTAGLAFETVVGTMEGDNELKKIVNEQYLAMCARVVNERFRWNDERRERLRVEIRRVRDQLREAAEWEDEDVRRARKRREGLERQQERKNVKTGGRKDEPRNHGQDGLEDGLAGLDIG